MKIYLAYSAVGGWSINSLSHKKKEILASFYYDKQEIKRSLTYLWKGAKKK